MAQGDTNITVVGNIVADPELRFTPSGAAVANFRVASTPRRYNQQTSQWEDGEAMFLTCNVWRQAAENVAETLTKGMRVVVTGKLRQRSYQTKEGENRTVFEVEVDEVGPSLKYASASVTRNPREGGAGGYGGGNQGGQRGGFGGNQGGFNQGGQGQNQGQNQGQGGYNPANGGFGGQSQGQGSPNQSQPQHDPWGSAPEAGGFSGGAGDEPPF